MFGMICLPIADLARQKIGMVIFPRKKYCKFGKIPLGNRWYTIVSNILGYPMFGLIQMCFDSWFYEFGQLPSKDTYVLSPVFHMTMEHHNLQHFQKGNSSNQIYYFPMANC